MVCGPLAYLAAARGIPVVLIFGLFGVLRFARFANASQLFSFHDRPTRAGIDSPPKFRADAMAHDSVARTFRGGSEGKPTTSHLSTRSKRVKGSSTV